MTDQKAETIESKPCAPYAREHRDAVIRRLYGTGDASARQIGEMLGISKNTVISAAHRMGLQFKRGSPELKARKSRGNCRSTPKPPPPRVKVRREDVLPGPAPRVNRCIKNPLAMQVIDRGRPAETFRVIERVAAKTAPKNRMCAWRTYEGNGRSMPCCEPAKPGHMWCEVHLEEARKLKEAG